MYDIESAGDRFFISYRDKNTNLPHLGISTYSGKAWQERKINEKAQGYPRTVAVHPKDRNTVFAGGYYRGGRRDESYDRGFVVRSDNGGKTWKEILLTGKADHVSDVCIDPSDPNVLIAAGKHGIHVSRDGGEKWEKTYEIESSSVHITGTGTAYAVCRTGIVRSDDRGKTWRMLVKGEDRSDNPIYRQEFFNVTVDEANDVLYACSVNGLVKIELQ